VSNVTQFPGKDSDWEAVTDVIHDDNVEAMAICVKYEDETVETMWIDATKADIAYFVQALQKDLHEWMEDSE